MPTPFPNIQATQEVPYLSGLSPTQPFDPGTQKEDSAIKPPVFSVTEVHNVGESPTQLTLSQRQQLNTKTAEDIAVSSPRRKELKTGDQ